jgi:hypothetical protein
MEVACFERHDKEEATWLVCKGRSENVTLCLMEIFESYDHLAPVIQN